MRKIFCLLLMLLPFGLFGQNDFVRHIITSEGEVTFWRGTQQLWVSSITSPPIYEATYYVAPWGDDDNPGTFEEPWQSWNKGFNQPSPGDTVYFRGGEYEPINNNPAVPTGAVYVGSDGAFNNFKNLWAYPGEKPVLNCYTADRSITTGIWIQNCQYFNLKGLEVKNVLQDLGGAVANGIYTRESNMIIIENCSVYDIEGPGFANRYCKADTVHYINCDSYSHYDPYTDAPNEPGGQADGFVTFDGDSLSYTLFKGCRAWECSDDGFDTYFHTGTVLIDSCWSFSNGYVTGNGFKLGPLHVTKSDSIRRIVRNCISSANGVGGFSENSTYPIRMSIYNNVSYDNGNDGYNFNAAISGSTRTFRNNISYANVDDDFWCLGDCVSDHNTWDDGAPTVTDADFVSLVLGQLDNPRQPDNSLPIVTYMHLIEGSDLIDAGVDVGLDYEGAAPDIGYAESNY